MSDLSPAEVDISVVVCTRNRADPLRQLLETMAAMRVPAGLRWELVLVDNGSSDNTPAVAQSFAPGLPIRYVREDQAGLSNARNRGVAEARGRYICWTDDDAKVDSEWLAAYAELFAAHPEAAVFGGQIIPVLEGPTPPWFAELSTRWPLNHIVAGRNFGDQVIPLDFSRDVVPWGVNFAIRRAEQRAHRYDPELGVSPHHRRSSEESQVMFEIVNGGATGWWTPRAKVQHVFPPHRQSREYVFEHFAAIGEAKAHLDHTRQTHVMNRDGAQPRLVQRSPTYLAAVVEINKAISKALLAVGLKLRSLYHLRRAGLYAGALKYAQSLPSSGS